MAFKGVLNVRRNYEQEGIQGYYVGVGRFVLCGPKGYDRDYKAKVKGSSGTISISRRKNITSPILKL